MLAALPFCAAGLPAIAQQGAEKPITLIYVGGWDCEPCIRWKKQHRDEWVHSPEFQKVNYVEIESPRLVEAYQDKYWPDQYKPIRDKLSRKEGTPRFIISRKGKILTAEFGTGEWERTQESLHLLLSN